MTPTLDDLARPSGGLAMVAMDQRESLRTMFVHVGRPDTTPADLTDFKRDVARVLSPHTSGFLIDTEFGYPQVRDEGLIAPGCGLLVAADALTQQPLGPVTDTDLDTAVLADGYDLAGVVALKLLLKWKRDDRRSARLEMAYAFAERCAELGVLSVLEPVVDAPDPDVAILEAARELSVTGQSLYKAQVPRAGRHGPELADACAALNAAVTGPWVVLSQGVAREDYLGAVEAACRAGASGFLAGRAIWSDLVGSQDLATDLERVAVPRLQALCAVVDQYATPWRQK